MPSEKQVIRDFMSPISIQLAHGIRAEGAQRGDASAAVLQPHDFLPVFLLVVEVE